MDCPSFEHESWIELDKGYYFEYCELNDYKLKHQKDKNSRKIGKYIF